MSRFSALTSRLSQQTRRQTLLITFLAIVVVFVLWNTSALSGIVYPLRLFVTYVHEAGHSLAVLLTGGEVLSFVVSPDGSGLTTSIGGNRILILPAGYIGAALFGSAVFFLVNRFPKYTNHLAFFLGSGMMLFTALYARPDEGGNLTALFLGAGFGVLLIIIGLKFPPFVSLLIVNILSVSCALEAVMDLWTLMQYSGATRGAVHNDAVAFAREITPLIPGSFIALTWAIASILILMVSIYYSVWRPLKNEVNEAYEAVVNRR